MNEFQTVKNTEFGTASFTYSLKGNILTTTSKVALNAGEFPIEKKDEFLNFFSTFTKHLKDVMVIVKKQE